MARKVLMIMSPLEQICNITEDEMFCFLILRDIHGSTVYSNLTGQFPIQSYTGMSYICVCYVYKPNTMLLRTMTSRETKDMLQEFESIYKKLEEKGHKPTLHVLNNECSRAVKIFPWKMMTPSISLKSTTMRSTPPNLPSSWPSTTPLPIWQPSTKIAQFNFSAN